MEKTLDWTCESLSSRPAWLPHAMCDWASIPASLSLKNGDTGFVRVYASQRRIFLSVNTNS